jgi:heme exporter protein A
VGLTNSLSASGIIKRFSARPLFAPVDFEARSGEIVAITGSNGTGKSTLLKILAHVLEPTKGTVTFSRDGSELDEEKIKGAAGFAAPYLELYNELSAIEHLNFIFELRGASLSTDAAIGLLSGLGLDPMVAKSDRQVKFYSSGMQQRVKLAMAFISDPPFIFLDEPGSNLDADGIDKLHQLIRTSSANGAIVMIATNDPAEVALAHRTLPLLPYTPAK